MPKQVFRKGTRIKKTTPTFIFNDQCGEVLAQTEEKVFVLMDSCKEEGHAYWFWKDELTIIKE